MAKKDYHKWSKDKLVHEIKMLLKRKKFGLVWEDQEEDVATKCEDFLPVLSEIKKNKIQNDKNDLHHIMIEGDNYHALSTLCYTHKKKVDVIYIDPPYNTGKKDFKYNDKFIDEEDKFLHSKWLSFMVKRLKLSKNLLKKDGIIFISIDDNEYAQLKMLCDETFDEKNLLSIHHIQVRYGNKNLNERKDFQELIEYVLIYAKDKSYFEANKPQEEYDLGKFNLEIKELKKPDETLTINGRKVDIFKKNSYSITKKESGSIELFKKTWISGSIYSGTGHGTMYQKVVEKRVEEDGLSTLYKIHGLGEDGLGFRYMINPQKKSATRGKMFAKVPESKKEDIKNGYSQIFRPIINYYDFSPDFGNIRHEGGISFNSGKKPVKMLKQFINYHKNKNATVLDFFAGSGTTGHATLELNKDDDGSRKFILCTNNENNNGDGGVATTVCYPRIKNVMNGYKSTIKLGGNLRYYKTAFVNQVRTDNDKRKLVNKSTEMFCMTENTFDKVLEKKDFYAVFENSEKITGIIYDEDAIDDFNKVIKKLEKPLTIYVFSYDYTYNKEDFEGISNLVEVKPVPEVILNVYRKIYKNIHKLKQL